MHMTTAGATSLAAMESRLIRDLSLQISKLDGTLNRRGTNFGTDYTTREMSAKRPMLRYLSWLTFIAGNASLTRTRTRTSTTGTPTRWWRPLNWLERTVT